MNLLNHCCNRVKHAVFSLWAILFQLNSFWLQLSYFITLSSLCFLTLKPTKTRSPATPNDVDLFFTAVSAVTVSSMSTLEMEVFSNAHLLFLTIFMFAGGEVFTSMLQLHLTCRANINKQRSSINQKPTPDFDVESKSMELQEEESDHEKNLKLRSIKILAYLISCYLVVVHALGSTLISLYVSLIPSARKILKSKQIKLPVFAIFTTVSTFTNCGFIPTNENMIVFKKNSGLLLMLIPQILMGNTLYPVFLRLAIWFSAKTTKRAEFSYMLKNSEELGYGHLLSPLHSAYLAITALGFVVLQFVVFCSLEWNSGSGGGGGSGYEKVAAAVFQVVNSRHAGESVFDLSAMSSAVLVMFIFMMYLPPYTSYLPLPKERGEYISTSEGGGEAKNTRKMKKYRDHILFSQLTYLSIFIILICITERRSIRNDPLNFNVLNIVLEVISAFGNVGFTVGYSCGRQINPNSDCKDSWSGFAGRWSSAGKFLLIVVMFFGRMKKFSRKGGRAWTLP